MVVCARWGMGSQAHVSHLHPVSLSSDPKKGSCWKPAFPSEMGAPLSEHTSFPATDTHALRGPCEVGGGNVTFFLFYCCGNSEREGEQRKLTVGSRGSTRRLLFLPRSELCRLNSGHP